MPGMASEWEMISALDIACAYPEHPMVRQFLERALRVAERAFQEKIPTDPAELDLFTPELVHLVRAKHYSRAILHGEPLDRAELSRTAEDLLTYSQGSADGWDDAAQSEYLQAVSLLLIAGSLDRARELLKIRRSFKAVKRWHEALKAVAETAEAQATGAGVSGAQSFEGFFSEIREPDWKGDDPFMSPTVLRFESALIRFLYVSHPGEPPAWPVVFRQISGERNNGGQ